MTPQRTPRDDLNLIESLAPSWSQRDHERRAAAWYGWRPSAARRCPLVIAGKRCTAYQPYRPLLICERLRRTSAIDHPRVWLTPEHGRILTSEPYQVHGEDLAGLISECGQLGLDVSLDGQSPYYPGRTMLIVIRRATS